MSLWHIRRAIRHLVFQCARVVSEVPCCAAKATGLCPHSESWSTLESFTFPHQTIPNYSEFYSRSNLPSLRNIGFETYEEPCILERTLSIMNAQLYIATLV